MIQILLVIFIIQREICNMDMQYSIWILFYMCVLFFQNSHKWSYFRIQQKNVSFIHIRILILQNFSLFSICEFFNIIDHIHILNFIICTCIKLHIHLGWIGASCHTFCFKIFEFLAFNISGGCDKPKFWVNPWLQLNNIRFSSIVTLWLLINTL